MGAFILYSIEYKIEAPMLNGSLGFVFIESGPLGACIADGMLV